MNFSLWSIIFGVVFSIAINSSINAKTFTFTDKITEESIDKTQHVESILTLTITQLIDNSGLVYLGGVVERQAIESYLTQMKQLEPEKYPELRNNQKLRDHEQFHVTLINPYELKGLASSAELVNKTMDITLKGLGSVMKDDAQTYFVVVTSTQGQMYRQSFSLKPKDFHITLGFTPTDIYGVSKGVETIIK